MPSAASPGRLATALHLLRGVAASLLPGDRCPRWSQRMAALARVRLVSFDIFDTLLFQDPDADARIHSEVCAEIGRQLAAAAGTAASREAGRALTVAEIDAALVRSREALCRGAAGRPRRPEVPRRALYRHLFADRLAGSGSGDGAAAMAEAVMAVEMDWQRRLTSPNAAMLPLLAEARVRGLRVVATSDTFLEADQLHELLAWHGIDGIGRIYASCEHDADKFHGGLFHHLLRSEGVAANECLHLGDKRVADAWSARACGIAALHHRPRLDSEGKAPQRSPGEDPDLYLGRTVLGPVFLAYAELLLAEVRRRGLRRLVFIARDGDLLREVVKRRLASSGSARPQLDYAHLSRRSTALPAARALDADAVRRALAVRTGGTPLERVLGFHGIDAKALPDPLRAALDPSGGGGVPPAGGALDAALTNPGLAEHVAAEARRQTTLLAAYLQQQGLARGGDAAWVDIGWHGSIVEALQRAFGGNPSFRVWPALYLGLWQPDGAAPRSAGSAAAATGLLGDAQRGRHLLEAAPWHLALVLESVCRAAHGTVLGYRRDDGDRRVLPVLADSGSARRDEEASEATSQRLRAGILACVAAAPPGAVAPWLHAALRRRTQRRLLRLAFFPRAWELQVLGALVHTESHAPDWRPALVQAERVSPWCAPRRWLAGLASPWRGGYVAATGGWLLAAPYLLVEALLAAAPGLQRRAQALARRAAGL